MNTVLLLFQSSDEVACTFDESTGLWHFPCRSNHKPKEMQDLELTRLSYFFFVNLFCVIVFITLNGSLIKGTYF